MLCSFFFLLKAHKNMQSSVVRGVKVVYCMFGSSFPKVGQLQKLCFITRSTAYVYVLMCSIYCGRTFGEFNCC